MINRLNVRLAGNMLLIILCFLAIMNILILFHVIPYDIIMGGQLKNRYIANIAVSFSLAIILLFSLMIAAKLNFIITKRFQKASTIGIWVMFIYFVINTIGNLASEVKFENFVFAPISIVVSLLTWRLAVEK